MSRPSGRARGAIAVAVAAAVFVTGCSGHEDLAGTTRTVTVFGPYRGNEADHFAEMLIAAAPVGVTVRYVGTSNFVGDLDQQLGEENAGADIAIVPQPGVVRRLVDDGFARELAPAVVETIRTVYPEVTQGLGEIDGDVYGVPVRISAKSLVYYRPDVFAEQGWQVPATLDELADLAERIAVTEMAPWCLAFRAGGATGWPATDWIEDLVVRRHGADVYEEWTAGTVPFASDAVTSAFEELRSLVLAPGYVAGGITAAVEQPTDQLFEGFLGADPVCAMAKQADFAAGWLPSGTSIGPDGDVDVFVLPGVEAGSVPPIVAGADVAVALNDSADVMAVLAGLAGPDTGRNWVEAGGYVSPKSTIGPDAYPTGLGRAVATTLMSTEEVVIDASDAMPQSVGTELYWSTITSWLLGRVDTAELARTLDDAYAAELGVEPADG